MLRAAELGLLVHKIATIAEALYRKRKLRAGMLDQDDLLKEARRLLTAAEFDQAQRRLRDSVRVLLVDEFQDTDQLQTDIVRALVGDREENHLAGNKLFFVGDEKQSIYRFRGAEPEVFRMLRGRVPEPGRLPLSLNFRSQPGVIDFVNALFAPIFGEGYLELRTARPQLGPQPSVEVVLPPPPPNTTQQSKTPVELLRKREARAVALRLRQLIDSGEPLIAEGDVARPACAGDVAILVRAHNDMRHYEEALRDAGFDYYVTGGLAFYSLQEVYDVINLLRVVDSTCDEISLLGVLRSPMFGLYDETLYWLARRGSLAQGFFDAHPPESMPGDQRALVERAKQVIHELRQAKARLGVAELLTFAIERTNYDATLVAEYLGERKLANLEKLIEQARQADYAGRSLREQLRQWNDFLKTPPKEAPATTSNEQTDAIRLMTVHHSKGLEFPIVVVPDLDRKSPGEKQGAAYHEKLGPMVRLPSDRYKDQATGLNFYLAVETKKKQRELERLFYVACTRAADRLILSACPEDLDKPQGAWLKLLGDRFDLRAGDSLLEVCDIGSLDLDTATDQTGASRVNLAKQLDAAQQLATRSSAPLPSEAAPIAIAPLALRWFSVSRLTGRLHRSSEEAELERPASARAESINPRALGTLVHAVIERLDPQADSWDVPIQQWAESLAPLHEIRHADEARQITTELVHKFVQTDRWRQMTASADFRREVEFLLAWPPGIDAPTVTIHGFIDALYQDSNGAWHLVDYKTNRVTVESVSQEAEHYRMQMAVYALAVEQALGVKIQSLTLCFLRPGVEHQFSWNETERTASIARVNQAIDDARAMENLRPTGILASN